MSGPAPTAGSAGSAGPTGSPADEVPVPPWLARLVEALPAAGDAVARQLADRERAADDLPAGARSGREAAVLVLFGPGRDGGGDVVLTERAAGLRAHPGQVAFPGGGLEPGDGGDAVRAALREAHEEVGLAAGGVRVLGSLPALRVPPTGASVVPVLGWDPVPGVLVADPAEVARVLRAPLPLLTDPAHRAVVRTPSGWTGPTFTLGPPDGLVVWGFTAVVLDALLRLAGLERPWDAAREVPLSSVSGAAAAAAAAGAGGRGVAR